MKNSLKAERCFFSFYYTRTDKAFLKPKKKTFPNIQKDFKKHGNPEVSQKSTYCLPEQV